jgi:hypothetical protein
MCACVCGALERQAPSVRTAAFQRRRLASTGRTSSGTGSRIADTPEIDDICAAVALTHAFGARAGAARRGGIGADQHRNDDGLRRRVLVERR